MKVLTVISFVVLIVLISLTQSTFSKKCLVYDGPVYRENTKLVDCQNVNNNNKANNRRTVEKRQSASPTDMFIVNFHCSINNTALCNQVKNVFISAGEFVTATLDLKTPITVNAQFLDFCAKEGDCSTTEVILGAARPTMMLPNKDTDGKTRLYPQALYKQLNLHEQSNIQMGSSDITAMFNSNMNYWFNGDPLPMQQNQVDLLYVVIHEMTHGLGFTNSWNQYLDNVNALTPFIGSVDEQDNQIFHEFIFDKNLVLLPSGTPLSSITDQLNQLQISSATTTEQSFITAFEASPQFQIAQQIYNNATKHGSIGFVLTPGAGVPSNPNLSSNNVFLLETTLVPFQPSSSIGHCDFNTYLSTSDFLMMYTYPPGETLGDMMLRAGSTNTTGPMGTQLRTLLGILGYNVKPAYTAPTLVATDSSVIGSSSINSFNLILSFVCILFTLLII